MIPTVELLHDFDVRLNKLSTNEGQYIPVEEKLRIINEAIINLIKQKIGKNNVYRLGLDSFKKRYRDLDVLITTNTLSGFKLDDANLNSYYVDITSLNPPLMFFIDGYVIANKGNCQNQPLYLSNISLPHSDITLYLQNPNYKPSFEYQETFMSISNNKFIVYTDGTFNIDYASIIYLKYPNKISVEGFVDFDGNESQNVDCELEYYLKDEILDLAVSRAAGYLGDANIYQISRLNSLQDE